LCAIRALAVGEVEDTGLLGVAPRQLLGWILGTGSAVLGLMVIGVVELADPRTKPRQLAVAIVVFCGIAMLGGLIVEYLAAQAIAAPLQRLRTALAAVQAGNLETAVQVDDATDVGLLQVGFNRMVLGLRERERTRDIFGRHVGEDVARYALETGGTTLGGQTRDVCTLFVDLVGSTSLAASHPANDVVELLNRFFAVVVRTIEQHGGSVNKFEGDAALAVFGAPDSLANAPDRALTAARTLAERLATDVPEIQASIGVSSGPAVAGNVGAEHRFEYTVIGDPVNEAARLTEIAKAIPGAVAASGYIVNAASRAEAARWQPHLRQTLRGRAEPTTIMTMVDSGTNQQGHDLAT
jgi:adenylate cyclase